MPAGTLAGSRSPGLSTVPRVSGSKILRIARRAGGLALLMVLSAGASGHAAAPTATVLELRVTGGRPCTATLVSARFVLTAAHCTRPRGRSASPARLRVYSRSGGGQFAKVAGVSYAPAIAGRRPDIALLQLTSLSRLRFARLPDRRLVPRRGTAVRVSAAGAGGRRRSRKARVADSRACGRASARGILCARLSGAVPSPRCSDAAGAALTLRRKRSTVLLGIGGRSPRGCRPSPRVRFANLSEGALRTWVVGTIAPRIVGGAPGGGSGGSGPGSLSPALPLGSWAGEISEDLPDRRSYRAEVTIDRDGTVGETVGRSDYSSGLCGGTLMLQGRSADGATTVLEHLTYGVDRCADGGTITLAPVANRPAISYSWSGAVEAGRSSGVLDRLP